MRFLFWGVLILLVILRFLTTRESFSDGQKVRLTTRILREPTTSSGRQNFSVNGLKISLPAFPEIHYGDRVVIEGRVKSQKLENAVLKKIDKKENFFGKMRISLISFYQKTLPEPHASLVGGITLGSKDMPYDFWNSLKRTGVLHVVVASGMNVSMVSGFLLSLSLFFLPRRRALVLAIFGIWLYVLVVGFEAPIVRAAIMGTIGAVAQALGRLGEGITIILLSLLIMLIIVPSWASDLGFALSFVATSSLMLFEGRIRKRLVRVPEVLRESLSTSLAAQIGVAPILFVTFGQFNPISSIINAAVLWTVPGIMVIGAIGGIIGLFLPELGKLVLYLSYPLTSWFSFVITTFG